MTNQADQELLSRVMQAGQELLRGPHQDQATHRADQPLTVETLRTIARALPFRFAEGERELGWQPYKVASVFVDRDAATGRWRIEGFHLRDQWNLIVFMSNRFYMPDRGPVLLTQRGREKTYATVDAILSDFRRILGDARGEIEIRTGLGSASESDHSTDEESK